MQDLTSLQKIVETEKENPINSSIQSLQLQAEITNPAPSHLENLVGKILSTKAHFFFTKLH